MTAGVPTREQIERRSAGFTWPPRPLPVGPAQPPPADPAQAVSAATANRRAGVWPIVERVWLDLIAPPLRERMRQLEWTPDAASTFCHRCAATVGPYEATADGCPLCIRRRLPWERIIRLGEYRPPLSLFIREVKFTRWRRLGRDLGGLLAEAARRDLAAAGIQPERCVVVPVPTSFPRRVARGIDHTWVLGAAFARSLGCPCVRGLSRRHTPSQLDVPHSERAANVAGAIRPRRVLRRAGLVAEGGAMLVVDDVTTTGATMRASCRAVAAGLREGGVGRAERPSVWAVVLAWTPADRRRDAPSAGAGSDPAEIAGLAWT